MNIKKLITVGVAGMAMGVMALDYVEVTDVKARQRYPWNGLVDIDFELDSKATEPYQMQVTVVDNVGKTNLPVKTVYTEGVSIKNNPCMVTKDTSRILWDAAVDLPDGFKCENVLVTCRDTRTINTEKLYMIVDVSAGPSASSYMVTYTNSVPRGGWRDIHKTTQIPFRRIYPGSFMMGSPASEIGRRSNETLHKVTLTKAFYMSVFELTEKQWTMIMGTATYGAQTTMRPKAISYNSLSASAFFSNLKSRTGLSGFNLPTEAQWEYACRAGTTTGLNNGGPCDYSNMSQVGRCEETGMDGRGGTEYNDASTVVGSYMPNAWGLYDMHGNAGEWVRDLYKEDLGSGSVTDPLLNSGSLRIVRGLMIGCYYSYDTGFYQNECRSASRNTSEANYCGRSTTSYGDASHVGPYGVRLVVNDID